MLIAHFAKLFGERAAVEVEIIGEGLTVEGDRKGTAPGLSRLVREVEQQPTPDGLGAGAEDALRQGKVFVEGDVEKIVVQHLLPAALRVGCAEQAVEVEEQHLRVLVGDGVYHHRLGTIGVGLGEDLPGRDVAQDTLVAPEVDVLDVDTAGQNDAQLMHRFAGAENRLTLCELLLPGAAVLPHLLERFIPDAPEQGRLNLLHFEIRPLLSVSVSMIASLTGCVKRTEKIPGHPKAVDARGSDRGELFFLTPS